MNEVGIYLDDFIVCKGLTDDTFDELFHCALLAESEEELQTCIAVTQFNFEEEE